MFERGVKRVTAGGVEYFLFFLRSSFRDGKTTVDGATGSSSLCCQGGLGVVGCRKNFNPPYAEEFD
jgi:hypothetical protein